MLTMTSAALDLPGYWIFEAKTREGPLSGGLSFAKRTTNC